MEKILYRNILFIFALLISANGYNQEQKKEKVGRKLIRFVIHNNLKYKTLVTSECLFKVSYKDVNLPVIRGSIKMVYDSAILITAVPAFGIEAGRILITKDSLFVVNRLNKWYIKSSLSEIGLPQMKEIKFKELQDLLIGNLPRRARWVMRKNSPFVENFISEWYIKIGNDTVIKPYLLLDIEEEKMTGIEIMEGSKSLLNVMYFYKRNNENLLTDIKSRSAGELRSKPFSIDVNMKNIRLNENLNINFPIGRNYKKIALNEVF